MQQPAPRGLRFVLCSLVQPCNLKHKSKGNSVNGGKGGGREKVQTALVLRGQVFFQAPSAGKSSPLIGIVSLFSPQRERGTANLCVRKCLSSLSELPVAMGRVLPFFSFPSLHHRYHLIICYFEEQSLDCRDLFPSKAYPCNFRARKEGYSTPGEVS